MPHQIIYKVTLHNIDRMSLTLDPFNSTNRNKTAAGVGNSIAGEGGGVWAPKNMELETRPGRHSPGLQGELRKVPAPAHTMGVEGRTRGVARRTPGVEGNIQEEEVERRKVAAVVAASTRTVPVVAMREAEY